MAQVIINASTRKKIDGLVDILIDEEYFVEIENAYSYVNAIYQFIESIPSQQQYPTNSPRFGKWYCRYKPNRHTAYYLTFDVIEDVYFVKKISSTTIQKNTSFI